MGPNYANLFVGFVEKQIFEQYTDPTLDYLGRYIDDCVGTASCSRGELEQFINYVNNFQPALQFTWEISGTSVSFLDILVSINGNRLVTSVFYKPTDSYSYLLYSSSHPNHTKRSIPFSQFLRLRRLCSEDEDFHTKSLEMRDFFVQHGYSTSLLDTAFCFRHCSALVLNGASYFWFEDCNQEQYNFFCTRFFSHFEFFQIKLSEPNISITSFSRLLLLTIFSIITDIRGFLRF